VEVPELNPKIMAYKIASMLQRGMHFRRVAYTALRRIMGAGAQGVEVTISGKIRGARSACAKFTDGYIKRCGEPSTRFVKEGFATVQLKPGVLGIYVRIMPPNVILPDKVEIKIPPKEKTTVDTVMETLKTEKPAESDDEDIESVEISETLETIETSEVVEEITKENEEEKKSSEIEITEETPKKEQIEDKPKKQEEKTKKDETEEKPIEKPEKSN